jgi:Transposase IS200 like
MPRAARDALGGYCYHVLNRGSGRRSVFREEGDFAAFAQLLCEAGERSDVRLLAYCLMGNHLHLLLWSGRDGDLPELTIGPVSHPLDWLSHVNEPQTEAELGSLRECIGRRRPYGDGVWLQRTARRMGLEASLRPRGRPPKKPERQAKSTSHASDCD